MFLWMDPGYVLVLGVGLLLSLLAQAWVKLAISRWSRVPLSRGLTGAEVAAAVLRAGGARGVHIEPVGGFLTDHYDPSSRTLRLSPAVYGGRSVAAAGIAAHEAGHAIQHAEGYAPMALRQKLVPVANIGTNLGVWLAVIGLALHAGGLARIGVLLFAAFVAFTLVTLPVEFDASFRARRVLLATGLVDAEEARGVSQVLVAAASTYLAAAVSAVLQLLYWAMRVGLLGGDDD